MKYNSAAAMQHIDDEIRTKESVILETSPLGKILSDTVEFELPKGFKKPELTENKSVQSKLTAKVATNFSFGNQASKQFNLDEFFPDLFLQK